MVFRRIAGGEQRLNGRISVEFTTFHGFLESPKLFKLALQGSLREILAFHAIFSTFDFSPFLFPIYNSPSVSPS